MNLKEIINKYLKGGKENYFKALTVIFLLGIIFVIAASFFKGSNNSKIPTAFNNNKSAISKTENNSQEKEEYENEIQNKLKDILSKLEGVGKLEVMVTFESGEENVPAINSNRDDSTNTTENSGSGEKSINTQDSTSSTVVTESNQDGSTKPYITKTYKPKVSSAFVVAEGAENSLTQARIVKAVTDLLNIPESKVNVDPMKK